MELYGISWSSVCDITSPAWYQVIYKLFRVPNRSQPYKRFKSFWQSYLNSKNSNYEKGDRFTESDYLANKKAKSYAKDIESCAFLSRVSEDALAYRIIIVVSGNNGNFLRRRR